MKRGKALIYLVAIASFFTSHAQEFITKCDVQIVRRTEQQLNNLTLDSAMKFFMTFGEECSNNAEFSEYWDEVMFEILDKHPEIYLQCMCELTDKKYRNAILEEIESPVNDGINNRGIREHLNDFEILQEKCQGKVLRETIHALDMAVNKK
ncbi:MAG TPA: hypothetical protein VE978_04575 [Chitinophagales bacterium]|nr:hypothetical protein [Chitinophagales bacterium]